MTVASPVEQFEIKTILPITIGNFDTSFTNSSLFMAIAVGGIIWFLHASMQRHALIPTRFQSMGELAYEFVANIVRSNVGHGGEKYFPFIFSLFMFVLFGNLLGMLPYSFTFTSHIIVTFVMAAVVFVGVTVIGFATHGLGYFKMFLPSGTPWYVAPLLIPIEILSYFTRPISLALRLFANLTAGHTLLKVFAGFVVSLGVAGVVPLIAVTALTGLEIVIAILQAFVFTVLSCIYLNDALHMH